MKINKGLRFELGENNTGLIFDFELAAQELQLKITNPQSFEIYQIEITLSYFNAAGDYLEFEDLLPEPLAADQARTDRYDLDPPPKATSCKVDIIARKQTFWRRHWKWLGTLLLILWTALILARRWPAF